jgi:sugar phosphate isomerase/epimerase
MYFGYNTNGFAHHRLEDALRLLADMGYQGIGLTLDHHALDPFAPDLADRTDALRRLLESLRLRCVIETGARFLLDCRRKHQPTLLSATAEERERRFEFLCRAVEIAAQLGADGVSFWSGACLEPASDAVLWERLTEGCHRLADVAEAKGVRLAFEPEPGMFVDTMPRYAELSRRVDRPNFGLTLDVGHLQCQGELPIEKHLRAWSDRLWNIHIEDMRRGEHEHLMFGEGEIDFAGVMRTLRELDYRGGVFVELSRHSHDAVRTAQRALAFLRGLS